MKHDYSIFSFGSQHGRLTFIHGHIVFNKKRSLKKGVFLCECGKIKYTNLYSVLKGLTKSCGCYHKEKTSEVSKTHGYSNSTWYSSWSAMHVRCTSEAPSIKFQQAHYKQRGIAVCDRWFDPLKFYEDMGDRPDGTSLDRIDTNGDYCKDNCRWTDMRTQTLNKRKRCKTTSKYKGVSWCKRTSKWEARCRDVNGKYRYLGMHVDEYDAYLSFKNFYKSEYNIELNDDLCVHES